MMFNSIYCINIMKKERKRERERERKTISVQRYSRDNTFVLYRELSPMNSRRLLKVGS